MDKPKIIGKPDAVKPDMYVSKVEVKISEVPAELHLLLMKLTLCPEPLRDGLDDLIASEVFMNIAYCYGVSVLMQAADTLLHYANGARIAAEIFAQEEAKNKAPKAPSPVLDFHKRGGSA